jgi:hypothetical protein
MYLKNFISLLIIFIFASNAMADSVSFYGGQYHVPDYYGPQEVTYSISKSNGFVKPNDKRDIYFNELTETDVFSLIDFWEEGLSSTANCPNSELQKNYQYIRYLYRLLAISYLFEALKKYDYYANLFGYKIQQCQLSYKEVFKGCSPKTVEMKKFVDRAKYRYTKNLDYSSYKTLSEKEQENWLQNFFHKKEPEFLHHQSHYYCQNQKGKSECGYFVKSDMEEMFTRLCGREKFLISSICSETDELYGMSYADQATTLIGQSNAFKIVNKSGMGYSCLERYARIHQGREYKNYYLKNLFEDVFHDLLSKGAKYAQGYLFLPGALKEFDEVGLKKFLFVAQKPLVIPKIKKYVEEPVYVAVAPKPEPPKPKPKPKAKPKLVKVAVKPKKKKKSAFLKAVEKLAVVKRSKEDVKMSELKTDFIFTDQMLTALKEPIEDYQTRTGLQEMVAYDKMGSPENPIRLLFLKYLIDTQSHQGLYNIQAVLGNYFYVENDIDKKKGPVFVQLHLSQATNFKWQITVVDKKLYEKEMKLKELE